MEWVSVLRANGLMPFKIILKSLIYQNYTRGSYKIWVGNRKIWLTAQSARGH